MSVQGWARKPRRRRNFPSLWEELEGGLAASRRGQLSNRLESIVSNAEPSPGPYLKGRGADGDCLCVTGAAGRGWRKVLPVCLCVVLTYASACNRDTNKQSPSPPPRGALRLISLDLGISQMIVDLGASDLFVAVADYDTAPPPGLPPVGNYMNIDTEVLLAARPTHVLITYGEKGLSQDIKKLAEQRGFELIAYPYPATVAAIARIVYHEPQVSAAGEGAAPPGIAQLLRRQDEGGLIRDQLLSQLAEIGKQQAKRLRPRVLMLISTEPPMASGPGAVLDDLLNMLGADNAVADLKASAPIIDKEMIITAAPDVILLLLPGTPPLRSLDDDPRLAIVRGLAVAAVQNKRIALINDSLVLLPSSSLVRIGRQMAAAIHGETPGESDKLPGGDE